MPCSSMKQLVTAVYFLICVADCMRPEVHVDLAEADQLKEAGNESGSSVPNKTLHALPAADEDFEHVVKSRLEVRIFEASTVLVLVFMFAAWIGLVCKRSTSRAFKVRSTAAWLSSLQLFVATIPLLSPVVRAMLPEIVVGQITVIMFWQAFTGEPYYGESVMYFFHMLGGAVSATVCVSFFNHWGIPGGQACYYSDECLLIKDPSYLVRPENFVALTMTYGIVTTWLVYSSNVPLDFKRVWAMTVGDLLLQHMNPHGDWHHFSPFFVEAYTLQLKGPGVWAILALVFGFVIRLPLQYWLPLERMSNGEISFSALHAAERGIKDLHANQKARLRSELLELGSSKSDSSCLAELSNRLEAAWWECITPWSRARLKYCQSMMKILQGNEEILVTMPMTQTSESPSTTQTSKSPSTESAVNEVLEPMIATTLQQMEDIIQWLSLNNACAPPEELEGKILENVRNRAVSVDEVLPKIQEALIHGKVQPEVAWSVFSKLHALAPQVSNPGVRNSLLSHVKQEEKPGAGLFDGSKLQWASVMIVQWIATVTFGLFAAGYSSTANTTAALMMLSNSLIVTSLERQGIRLLGLTGGMVVLCAPAFFMCRDFNKFDLWPDDFIAYYCWVLIFWTWLSYGSGMSATYGYAFQTAMGFGAGVFLAPMDYLYPPYPKDTGNMKLQAFQSILFASIGMQLVTCTSPILFAIQHHNSRKDCALALAGMLSSINGQLSELAQGKNDFDDKRVPVEVALKKLEEVVQGWAQISALFSESSIHAGLGSISRHVRMVQTLAKYFQPPFLDSQKAADVLLELLPLKQLLDLATAVDSFSKKNTSEQVLGEVASAFLNCAPAPFDMELKTLKDAKDVPQLREAISQLFLECKARSLHLALAEIAEIVQNHL
mmetsp:Transcript_29042/g.52638  ORF Transcript_29042/g.52638 Transcript_29042/m.52638 type:complete len:891 (+) Transcript_29042:84-2756(+)